ncbi:mRNA interferase MazF [Deinococcus reticulitermitis]|uniref:mRNA interferase MazF n=1 Tax=Deinococcus reticulitermitis TaxID=856736 RepID=A0A1H7AXH9_9DEIO|nr:type II toxin-antitoxin system PemK/MazF family toxin [Deinococcus reticulitermitis]SEJ70331.1 mRNA interferase MazF [Deinococcus reticulitermitis]
MSGVRIGDVLKIQFPAARPPGHEQVGTRPAVVVGIPDRLGSPRFPGLIVVPLTTSAGDYVADAPALYPMFPAGTGGLTADSVALTDQVRAVSVSRILSRLGTLTPGEYAPVQEALRGMLEL